MYVREVFGNFITSYQPHRISQIANHSSLALSERSELIAKGKKRENLIIVRIFEIQ